MVNKINVTDNLLIKREKLYLILIVGVNLLIKVLPASVIELGNDEVYYWTYALFPDWSHFDHPPMVGLTIQLFTLNLHLVNEFFMRLGALILSSAGMILLFYLVKKIYSPRAAFISILLYTASLYFNIISGLFILPDTPQNFFVMLALYYGIPAFTAVSIGKKDEYGVILFGLFTGLAFLSKYHSLFLWLGAGIYVILHDRRWLRKASFYLSILITLFLTIPVIYWNINNDFWGFTFHESRIGLLHRSVNIISFLTFNLGQILYQNPVLFIIFIIALISLYKHRKTLSGTSILLICISIPLIATFTVISIFNNTLPHWSGPAFIGLIIIASQWLSERSVTHFRNVLNTIIGANMFVLMIILAAFLQINTGIISSGNNRSDPKNLGQDDLTLDMYGWNQARIKFQQFLDKEGIDQEDHKNVKIISSKWFPAAHLDFYIAHPLGIDLFVPGSLTNAHKYYWINKARTFNPGDKVYYITMSQQFFNPEELAVKPGQIIPKDTLAIIRNGTRVENLFIYELKGPDLNLR